MPQADARDAWRWTFYARWGCLPGGLAFRDEQHEARKILGIVLHGFGEDNATVMVGGALSAIAARDLSWRARTSHLPAVSSVHAFP